MYVVNLSQDKSKINNYISNTLLKEIWNCLEKNKKIILYLNKRWDYSALICNKCNYLYKCGNCDVPMIVHKYPEKLLCHICWNKKEIPQKCEKCNNNSIQKVWIWTQQIEYSLENYFKNFSNLNKIWKKEINIFRFDTDSIKNKKNKEIALEKIEKSDIIIGTKMITTWFDFKNIWLIWVILLEQELLIPKYNTEEKVYINIKQLIWRWSRKWEKTEVIIQTLIPENEIIKNITLNNYKKFFLETLKERKIFNYPPFSEILILEYKNKNKEKSKNFIDNLKNKLDIEKENNKTKNIEIIKVPNPSKKYNQYYYKIIIKWDNVRDFINCIKKEILKNSWLIVIFE